MKKIRYSRWRKLDNAAQAFPAATGKNDTRVFRFYCLLKEEVSEELLQQALDRTMERYPLFRSVLRKGVFWFYMEMRDLPALVKPETRPPCSKLYVPDQKQLLFEVTYHKNRINFEVFHGLTDGTGAMIFLKELVKNYLQLCHPDKELPDLKEEQEATGSDQEEDSFSHYYSKRRASGQGGLKRAYQLRGELREHQDMPVIEMLLSAGEVRRKAKEYGVSVTVFLSAVFLCAIQEEIPASRRKKPVALMIPVNLRNYFPSRSMINFFSWIEAGCRFKEGMELKDVIACLKEVFQKELVKENIDAKMSTLVRLERNPLLRAVPLEIKNLLLMAGTTLGGKSVTAVFSNMGQIQMPEGYGKYIERFGFFTSTGILQLCSCTYQDQLALGFTSKLVSENIQRNFQRILRQEGIGCRELENDFPGAAQKKPGSMITGMRIFTFLCAAAVVLCWMVNFLATPSFLWGGYVMAGVFCMWLLVIVGYRKRKNLLKNGMWQLLIVTAGAFLWDHFTGYQGWSLDFVLPFASLTIQAAMFVIARVCRMETEEYLFYLVQAAAVGCIPAVLYFAGAVTIQYPSVLCGGISVLILLGIAFFRRRELLQEIRKKFRL